MSGATANGTITVDPVAGVFDSIDVTVSLSGTDYLFTGAPVVQSVFNNNTQFYEYSFDHALDYLVIDLPGSSLVGFTGGNLCSGANLCGDGYAGDFSLHGGTPDELATGALIAAPEPPSMLLLGTGLLVSLGVVHRKAFARRT